MLPDRSLSRRSRAPRSTSALLLGLAALLALQGSAHASPQAQERLYKEGEVIVRFRDDAPPAARDAALAAFTLQRVQSVPHLRCELVRAPIPDVDGIVAILRANPAVELAQPNYVYQAFGSAPQIFPQDPFLDPASPSHTYGPLLTRLPSLWRSSTGGAGIKIAVLDTGVDLTHPEFAGRLLPGFDFVNQDAVPADDDGHGTHVTGIAAAAMNAAGGVGVAPLASILPVKVLAAGGSGTTLWVMQGLDYARTQGAHVINMSLGLSVDDPLVREAVADAYAAGCTIVAASGNGGGSPIAFPAGDEEVISVGAVGSGGTVTSYSQYGPTLDVVAPGDAVYSTWMGGGYAVQSGTSMAAPFVSGLCALIRGDFPGIKSWELEAFLRDHTRNTDAFTAGQAGNKDGYGLVSFGSLKDFGNGTDFGDAWSNNFSHEWLGADVTGESSMVDDAAVGNPDHTLDATTDDYMPDLDGPTNQSGEDGADDGLFPASHPDLPLLPWHIGGSQLEVDVSVGNHSGPRYSGGQQLFFDVWADFDDDGLLAPAWNPNEHLISGVSSPSGWSSNTQRVGYGVVPPDDHYRGDPLRFRTRLWGPGGGGPTGPIGAQATGEVEDQQVLNFVEDFDTPDFHAGYYAILQPHVVPQDGGWMLTADPGPNWPPPGYPPNHGQWHYASTDFISCLGLTVDTLAIIPDVPLDMRELTFAHVRLFVIHGICVACPGVDSCRLSVRTMDTPGGAFVEANLVNFLQPDFCTGQPIFAQTIDVDLSPFVGKFVQVVVHHNTQFEDMLAIDDVAIYGYDGRAPQAPAPASTTTANRVGTANWTNPNENNPPVAGPVIAGQGAFYALRLAIAGGVFNWANGFRLTPRDFANGGSTLPIVGAAGTAATASLRIPTTFPDLALAIREGDEVVNLGTAGTTTLSVNPTFIVDVVAPGPIAVTPGQTLDLDFTVTNLSSALDALAIGIADTQTPDWTARPLKRTRVLAPLVGAVERVRVGVPSNATVGTIDTITLTATSLSNAAVLDSDSVVLTVVGGGSPCIGTVVCSGDGTSGPCPCANTGISGRGCDNSDRTGGSLLCITGTPSVSADTVLLTASAERATAFSLFLQGTTQIAPVIFGDGLRCTGGLLKRLYTRNAVAGTAQAPIAGELSVTARSAALGNPIGATESRWYQVYYRDPVTDFCPNPPGNTFNVSNAVRLDWGP